MEKKVSYDFLTTFLRGIGCNWMVCMAVFLCGQAQDMTGKYLAIWFPISTFVMIGFEHIPANFYLLEIGLLAPGHDVTFWDVLLKNWIPVTIGNFVAGAFIVAGGYSFAFGRLGESAHSCIHCFKKKPKAPAAKMMDEDTEQPGTIRWRITEETAIPNADSPIVSEASSAARTAPPRQTDHARQVSAARSAADHLEASTFARCVSEASSFMGI
eukprot:TRINITY_DN7890_c0_g3_i1.p1 TRINITY_DN7890_c0_g3~~TRINITY_DN7890_c0_g3_i1.p1  ORF type:complete len:213 (+),score=24.42 TRINITY_DN7890_c0_g3_i1:404-1042(+)